MRFVVEVDEQVLQDLSGDKNQSPGWLNPEAVALNDHWLELLEEHLDYEGVSVRKYAEPWDEVPLDRMLNKLTVYMRSGKDAGLVKDWAKVILKEELKDAF